MTADKGRTTHGVVVALALLFGLFATFESAGIRINTTLSLPLGLYVQTASQSSLLVEFCPTGKLAAVAAGRGYGTSGNCPDGASAFLKPIVAQPGDVVDLSMRGICVNHHLIRNTAPLSLDTHHRPLKHFPFGHYQVGDDEMWVASSYNKRSFDSRYYGPILKNTIRRHLRPLLTL